MWQPLHSHLLLVLALKKYNTNEVIYTFYDTHITPSLFIEKNTGLLHIFRVVEQLPSICTPRHAAWRKHANVVPSTRKALIGLLPSSYQFPCHFFIWPADSINLTTNLKIRYALFPAPSIA